MKYKVELLIVVMVCIVSIIHLYNFNKKIQPKKYKYITHIYSEGISDKCYINNGFKICEVNNKPLIVKDYFIKE